MTGLNCRRISVLPRVVSDALLNIFIPTQCVGCGRWDTSLCSKCSALATDLHPRCVIFEDLSGAPWLPFWSLSNYGGIPRRIIISAKHCPTTNVQQFLYEAGKTLAKAMCDSPLFITRKEIWVVPAPSGFKRRFRGQLITRDLARGVACAVSSELNVPTRVVECVRLRLGARSQSGKSGRERRSGRHEAMILRVPIPQGVCVVLVDDVVTTGATLLEMSRVCGATVAGFVSLCVVAK